MKITYETTLQDAVAFFHYHSEHSHLMKRTRRRLTFLFGLALLFVCVISGFRNLPLAVVVGALALGVLLLTSSWVDRRLGTWQTRKAFEEGKNKATFGLHELELTDENLITRTRVAESRIGWEAVERVASTADHTFIYVSALSAEVIPRRSVTEGDYDAFVKELNERWQRGIRSAGASSCSSA